MTVTIEKITVEALASALDTSTATPVVLDVRAEADYKQGHIPGALHVDPLVFGMPYSDPRSLAQYKVVVRFVVSRLGIQLDSSVVVVGAANEANAARVVWALAYAGVRRVAVLDKGYTVWAGALSQDVPAVQASSFTPDFQEQYLTTAQSLVQATSHQVLDAREWADFAGHRSSAKRAGRIPGAKFWDTASELDAEGGLSVPAAHELPQSNKTVVYCGGGGRAARTFLTLQLAGHTQSSVYPSSWGEWGNDSLLPIENNLL